MSDLTIIYYTANTIPQSFYEKTKDALLKAVGDTPIISISHKPMNLGNNICVGDIGKSNINIYKQILIGAKEATTEWVAMAEDDTFYHESHFGFRPKTFGYNMNKWSIFTYSEPPIFSNRGRKTLNALICPRLLLISALEDRFSKYPDESKIPECYWGEFGRNVYERNLGVKEQPSEIFESEIPIIMFTHPEALSYKKPKKLGEERLFKLPYWGKAEDIVKYYEL